MHARAHISRIGRLSVTAAALALVTGTAHAADPIVGAWLGTVQPADCTSGQALPAPASRGMLLYHFGGTLNNVDTSQGGRTLGFGTWWHDRGTYQTRFTFIRVADGEPVGTTLVARSVTLGADRTTSKAFAVVHLFDMAGQQVAGPFCSIDTGVRLP